MKNQKIENYINLETLAGGAFTEKLNEALMQVAENIQNPNTDATAKRGITVNIKFSPSKNRQMVNTSISVSTKLAAAEAIDTQMIMGVNMKTGKVEIAEYDGQIRGQMKFPELDELEGTQQGEAAPDPQQADGKPLDLRKRENKPEPGRDFDPNTGEIYETAGQPADDRRTTAGRVVPIGKRSAQA